MDDYKAIAARTQSLAAVAMGRDYADLVLKSGKWVSVQSGEILPGTDIAVKGERIAYIGPNADHTIGPDTEVVDASGYFLTPGLLDAHMHVESGMVTVTEFVRAVAPRGTTGMFIDPHEIANVFGLRGVELMVREARQQLIHVWVQIPSCVPSAPGLETPGGTIGPEEVAEAMQWEGVIGLGEMMNFPGVIRGDEAMHAEMAATRRFNKVVGGHYASSDLGVPFHAYAAGGAQDDHEGTRTEDAAARVRQGMKVMMRLGSAWHDVAAQVKAVTELGLDPRYFLLCTDDSHSGTLVGEGHMDRVLRHTIDCGAEPLTALQMATLNTAEHFGLAGDIGMLAPGRYADILLVRDLDDFRPEVVFARGQRVAQNGQLLAQPAPFKYPEWAKNSVRLGRKLQQTDFRIPAPEAQGKLTANVIGVIENQAPTRHLQKTVEISAGEVRVDLNQDLLKIALVERHRGTGGVQIGLVHGFGFTGRCAVATTIAHDSHHMIVVGTSEADMAVAANYLGEINGGQVVVRDGAVLAAVELPIAGLMSDEPAEIVAEKAAAVLAGFRSCGCNLNNPNMQLSLLALVVIPELRISDLGLVDVNRFDFVPLFEGF